LKLLAFGSTRGGLGCENPVFAKFQSKWLHQQMNSSSYHLRHATAADIPALHDLIALSVRGLMTSAYSSEQLEKALGVLLGVDTQLIEDGTYFVVDAEDGMLVGCGGWSKRKTLFGADHRGGRDAALLDPAQDAAKIRAFFVHPEWARRGVGSAILGLCEQEASSAGFRRFEMGATLSGVPLYKAKGYVEAERIEAPLPGGGVMTVIRMTKESE
jgi:N-acetylglutamate synthase-like GNAT family acetyltransferase